MLDVPPFRATLAMLAVPGMLQEMRVVPHEFVRAHGDGKCRVMCPCGFRPVLRFGEIRSCRDNATSPHRCQRVFFCGRESVRVANSPV